MKSAIRILFMAGITPMIFACAEADSSTSEGTREDLTEAAMAAAPEVDHSAHVMDEPEVEVAEAPAEEPPAVEVVEADAPDSPKTIYSGIYTAAQADRGKSIQEAECFVCHAADDWAGGRLLTNYTGQSMLAFVEHLRSTMPLDEPGRLEYGQYVDVAARILQINNVPTGSSELSTDTDELAAIRMEYRR